MEQKHPAEQVVDFLAPHVAALGYTQKKSCSTPKGLLSWRLKDPDPERTMSSTPMVEVFMSDAYPNDRGEVFLHVWSWTGSEAPTHVCDHLKRLGLKARVTTHKKSKGIRLQMEIKY